MAWVGADPMSKPKDPNRICGWSWYDPDNRAYDCAHVCHLTVADHGEYHECCNAPNGREEI